MRRLLSYRRLSWSDCHLLQEICDASPFIFEIVCSGAAMNRRDFFRLTTCVPGLAWLNGLQARTNGQSPVKFSERSQPEKSFPTGMVLGVGGFGGYLAERVAYSSQFRGPGERVPVIAIADSECCDSMPGALGGVTWIGVQQRGSALSDFLQAQMVAGNDAFLIILAGLNGTTGHSLAIQSVRLAKRRGVPVIAMVSSTTGSRGAFDQICQEADVTISFENNLAADAPEIRAGMLLSEESRMIKCVESILAMAEQPDIWSSWHLWLTSTQCGTFVRFGSAKGHVGEASMKVAQRAIVLAGTQGALFQAHSCFACFSAPVGGLGWTDIQTGKQKIAQELGGMTEIRFAVMPRAHKLPGVDVDLWFN